MKNLIKNKVSKIITRHPILYYIRYLLISKNHNQKCSDNIGCFNDSNSIEDVPLLFFEINKKINLPSSLDEFDKAILIANYLNKNSKAGQGLGLSSKITLEKLINGKGGVCSDFSLLFSVFCLINNIKVKEWGCTDKLYKSEFGHSFNEIYSTKQSKWIAIDSQKGIYFINNQMTPLSTIELFEYLRLGNDLEYILFSVYNPKNIVRLNSVYSKITIPFIINNYNLKINDYYLDKYQNKYPLLLINILLILKRKNHNFIFILDNYKKRL